MHLRFAARYEHQPGVLDPSSAGVHVWRTPEGALIAHGYKQEATYWMHWPSVAAFRFAAADQFITAFVNPHASRAVVEDVYRRGVLPMATQALGREALHASGVLTAAGVVAFAARSHTGKSTLAYGLSRRGFVQWADDGVAFDVSGGGVSTFPMPFHVRLRAESSRLVGFEDLACRQFEPSSVIAPGDLRPTRLSAICLLRRLDDGWQGPAAYIERIEPAKALMQVLVHAHEFNPHDEDRRCRMLQAYLELVDLVPVYDLGFAPGTERFAAVLEMIASILELEPAPGSQGAHNVLLAQT